MRPSRFRTIALATAAASVCAVSSAQTPANAGASTSAMAAPLSAADKSFVNAAALGGMTEVKLGELASSKGQSQAVKSFGQKMVEDHTKANEELGGIAKGKGVAPPASLDDAHQKIVDKFAALDGPAFDKAYWTQMRADHKKTIALFKKESASGKDADIKAFSGKTLPTLDQHLKMVQDAMSGKDTKMSAS